MKTACACAPQVRGCTVTENSVHQVTRTENMVHQDPVHAPLLRSLYMRILRVRGSLDSAQIQQDQRLLVIRGAWFLDFT